MASNNVLINTEPLEGMPTVQGMVNQIRESLPSAPEARGVSSSTDDLAIIAAIAEPSPTTPGSQDETEGLSEALNSASRWLGGVARGAQPPAPGDQSSASTASVSAAPAVDSTTQATAIPSAVPSSPVAGLGQHIMLSYNRSCDESCRKIRDSLKNANYQVWMDIFDMEGNFIEGMANAIRNSYVVLMCINRNYVNSFWCKKEAEYAMLKQIKCIPCFMESPFQPDSSLDFVIGANCSVDFSEMNDESKYGKALQELIRQIGLTEATLMRRPRAVVSTSVGVPPVNLSNAQLDANAQFEQVARTFKGWVEDNRASLEQTNPEQAMRLVQHLLRNLFSDSIPPNNKDELIQRLLLQLHSPSASPGVSFSPSFTTVQCLLIIMALWAIKVIFERV